MTKQISKIKDSNELNKRCAEVFDLQEGDFVWSVWITEDGLLKIEMQETDENGNTSEIFYYEPDTICSPEIVAYLMGDIDEL